MRKPGLIAAAALVAAALPIAIATGAMAQVKTPLGARVAPAAPAGGGMKAGPIGGGGGAFRGGMVATPPRVGIAPQAGWSGPRPAWHGGNRWHDRRWVGPGIGFGTGLLLGGVYAASPYYYGPSTYYYDEPYETYPYDDGYVLGGTAASPAEIAYCRQRYRSYDVRTGTFLGNDGRRRPCP
jgi:BA14K-like protein